MTTVQQQAELLVVLTLDLLAQVEAQRREVRRIERRARVIRSQLRQQLPKSRRRPDTRQLDALQAAVKVMSRANRTEHQTLAEVAGVLRTLCRRLVSR